MEWSKFATKMYAYEFCKKSGGITLLHRRVNTLHEVRPVFAQEMDLLGLQDYFNYDSGSENPYMWEIRGTYYYRGTPVLKRHGGDMFTAPTIEECIKDVKAQLFQKQIDKALYPINIKQMCNQNRLLAQRLTQSTINGIQNEHKNNARNVDITYVAFSGGKDSVVLFDLVQRAIKHQEFCVVFNDTKMELKDTYNIVDTLKSFCYKNNISIYISQTHLDIERLWKTIGPPSRTLRWCHTICKVVPQVLLLKNVVGKSDYKALAFLGTRASESVKRKTYKQHNIKNNQHIYYPVLHWNSAEVWNYIFENKLPINNAYKLGCSRVGCVVCPMASNYKTYIQCKVYKERASKFIDIIRHLETRHDGNISEIEKHIAAGGWNARRTGKYLKIASNRYKATKDGDQFIIEITSPTSSWKEWIKTVGDIPFQYEYKKTNNGYLIKCSIAETKSYAKKFKLFKQVFKKASHCIGCKYCESLCKDGAISFDNEEVKITNCTQCKKCHEPRGGCIVYDSLRTSW